MAARRTIVRCARFEQALDNGRWRVDLMLTASMPQDAQAEGQDQQRDEQREDVSSHLNSLGQAVRERRLNYPLPIEGVPLMLNDGWERYWKRREDLPLLAS